MDSEMKIKCSYSKMLSLDEIKKKWNPDNPNEHDQVQIEILAKILKYQGIRQPIRISNLSDRITAGHGRLLAAEHLGWTEFPCDFQDYENRKQEYSDIVADNEIAKHSILNWNQISLSLPELDIGLDYDFELLGTNDFFNKFKIDMGLEKESDEEIKGELEFSKELNEENNYIVLLFRDKDNFYKASDYFGLTRVITCLAKNGNPKMNIIGLGRIISGDDYIGTK